VAGKTEQEAK